MDKDHGQPLLKMGEITRLSGVSPRAVRHYERLGLLQPTRRTPGGYRIFHPDTLQRVLFIRRAQALGFTLDAIRGLLQAQRKGDAGCRLARNQMRQRVVELAELLQSLRDQEAHLQVLAETCERCENTCLLKAEPPLVGRLDPSIEPKLNPAPDVRPLDIHMEGGEALSHGGNIGNQRRG